MRQIAAAILASLLISCGTTVETRTSPNYPELRYSDNCPWDLKDVETNLTIFRAIWYSVYPESEAVYITQSMSIQCINETPTLYYGLTTGENEVVLWTRDVWGIPKTVGQSSLCHELVHVSLGLDFGDQDIDHLENERATTWKPEHEAIIDQCRSLTQYYTRE